MRRVPLWLTVLPLVVGGFLYWQAWSGWRDRLRDDLARVLPGQAAAIGGFPYRLEADVASPRFTLAGPIRLDLAAARARVNRTPWGRALTVVRGQQPTVALALTPLAKATLDGRAATGSASLHLLGDRIGRLSLVFDGAALTTGLLALPIAADHLELHLREVPARSNEAWAATPPQQAQAVVSGTRVRFGTGAPLSLTVDAAVTATARLHSLADWANGGTVELHDATLADASGEVARLTATVVADHGTVRLAGTVTTVCPRTLAAAFADAPPMPESRLRNAVRLTFGGTPGAFVLGPEPANAPTAVRGQLPPCPRLR